MRIAYAPAVAVLLALAGLAAEEPLAPALSGVPSKDGLVTWWLAAQAAPTPPAAGLQHPLAPREGQPLVGGGGAGAANAGRWSLQISDAFYNDFHALTGTSKAPLYAALHVRSVQGGARVMFVRTFCATKIWAGNLLIIERPKPDRMTMVQAPLQLAKGDTEICVELTPRAEGCLMQCYLLDARNPAGENKPAPGDSILLPIEKDKTPDSEDAAFRSLAVAAKSPFIMPGGTVGIAVEAQGSAPSTAAALTARMLGADGKPSAGGELSVTTDRPALLDYHAPPEPKGIYEVRVEFLAGQRSLGTRRVTLVCLEGFRHEIEKLEQDLAARSAKTKNAFPNCRLALEKLNLMLNAVANGIEIPGPALAGELTAWVQGARTSMDLEEKGEDPLKDKTGYMERAYISAIDGGVQPYIVSVPDDVFRSPKPLPLVIFLHGYDPSIDKHRWWEAKDFALTCARNGCCMAIPFGRSNTDFQTCGEVDVLDVIAQMQKYYRIDPERVYLYGYSMGGMAVYTIGAHYPDLFAGAIVLAGRADNPLQNYSALENFHPFKAFMMRNEHPLSLCENLSNVPLRIYHGLDDAIVPKTEAMRMGTRFKELGADAQVFLKPGGHTFGFEVLAEDEPLQWLLSKKRNAAPARRTVNVYSLQYAKQDGVQITAEAGGLEPLRMSWTEAGGKKSFVEQSANIMQKRVDGELEPKLEAKLRKTPELCGPARQAFRSPFTIVYGTIGNAAANERNRKNADRFAAEWFAFTRSPAVIKADKDVTAEDNETRNLFVFGEQQENAIHQAAAAAAALPVAVKDGSVTIAGKTVALGANRGVIFMVPNPLAKFTRALVVFAGLPYGDKIGVNHKLDLVPDFLVYDDTFEKDGTSTNHALCAGFFDGEWKVDEKTTWWMNP